MAIVSPTNTTITYAELISETDIQQWVDSLITLATFTRNAVAFTALANGTEILPKYGAHAYHNANIAHTSSGSWQTVATLNSEFWDTDGLHSLVTNTGRLTFQRAGMYALHGSIYWAANATGDRGIRLTKNTVTICEKFQNASAGLSTQRIADNYYFAVNDYVELGGFQNSGGNLNMQANSVFGICLKAEWIGVSP